MFALCPDCNLPVRSRDEGYYTLRPRELGRTIYLHKDCTYTAENPPTDIPATPEPALANEEENPAMAQKVSVVVLSDLSDAEGASTLAFGVDGDAYEIDLTDDEASAFRELLAPYVGAARRVKSGTKRATPKQSDYNPREVREWATKNGHEVPARGRIPEAVVTAYKEANK